MIIKDKNKVDISINPRYYVKAIPLKVGGCLVHLAIDGMESTVQSCMSVQEIDELLCGKPKKII